MTTWKELRDELNLSESEKKIIAMEEELIRTMIKIREEKGLTQSQLAKECDVKQPLISRMEKDVHSPRLDSILRVLEALGYTLQIVPMKDK